MIGYSHKMTTEEKLMLSRAMFHIGRMSETKPAYDFLVCELQRLDTLNRSEPDETTFRMRQGACTVIEDLTRMIDKARDQFDRFDKMKAP
jgi:hypothetical protein